MIRLIPFFKEKRIVEPPELFISFTLGSFYCVLFLLFHQMRKRLATENLSPLPWEGFRESLSQR